MSIASFVIVYVIAWWLSLFILLPIGVERDDDPREGNDAGAPVKHMIGKKMLGATIAAFVALGVYWYLAEVIGITLRPD